MNYDIGIRPIIFWAFYSRTEKKRILKNRQGFSNNIGYLFIEFYFRIIFHVHENVSVRIRANLAGFFAYQKL